MPSFIDSAEIELPCEKCGRKTKKSIGWIKTHSKFTCACGVSFSTSALNRELASSHVTADAIKRALEKLQK